MKNFFNDTIVAQATPPGRGGIGIIRVSGKLVTEVALSMLGKLPPPRLASFCQFRNRNQEIIDQGIVLFFPGPNSFTGEDVLELHGHGGIVVIDQVLKSILQLGARLARPGEFSERAFLNNKIDLTQAEAIADLIDATSQQAAKSALRSLNGLFSTKINELLADIIRLRMFVEAAIDFPDEEIDFLAESSVVTDLKTLIEKLNSIFHVAKQGAILKNGMRVVIAGAPNAGKSSLLNSLSGQETAIVSDIPGTTRDILRETIQIDGLPLFIVDTAGLRQKTTDVIEQEGIRRAKNELLQADRILWVVDSSEISYEQSLTNFTDNLDDFGKLGMTIIRNKIDITKENLIETADQEIPVIQVSAKTGQGMDKLKQHLKNCMGYDMSVEDCFIARRRHLDALHRATGHFKSALIQLEEFKAGELLAEELRYAQTALSEITGEFTTDDLLGHIFSNFCIGK